jgi:hypothetical protein
MPYRRSRGLLEDGKLAANVKKKKKIIQSVLIIWDKAG